MTVTKQTYTAAATWTVSQLADIFRSAFIDAGLMTDWFDSFLSGSVENRILKVEYDNTKAFGSTFVWFKFLATGFGVSTAATWDAVTHTSTGSYPLNALNATTNAIDNHHQPITMATNTSVSLSRYTSGIDTNYSYFLVRYASSSFTFSIDKGVTVESVVDLDKQNFISFNRVASTSDAGNRGLAFETLSGHYRRNYFDSANTYSQANSTLVFYRQWEYCAKSYSAANINTPSNRTVFWLPIARPAANPAFLSDKVPLFSGLRTSLYTSAIIPADFGVMPHYPNSTMVLQDRMIINGSEEWEILAQSLGDGANVPSVLFVARLV